MLALYKTVLDSDSDEELGWSRSRDLPKNRLAQEVLDQKVLLPTDQPGTSTQIGSIRGPGGKRLKLMRHVIEKKVEEVEDEETRRMRFQNWPEELLKRLVTYLPLDDRIKLRTMCKSLRNAVDMQGYILYNEELDIRRLEETEIGLMIPVNEKEPRYVIGSKNLEWHGLPKLRTFSEMRRGIAHWTRHHRNRMGRIKTAMRMMFKHAHILKVTVSQVNLSNSFIRDLHRVLDDSSPPVHSLRLEFQAYEHDRPDLSLLNGLEVTSIGVHIRLKEREPLPQIESFLDNAVSKFNQIILEIRRESWKFHSTMHYRQNYEDYGMNWCTVKNLLVGDDCNHIRLKFFCRSINTQGVLNLIFWLREQVDKHDPSRGFCIILQRDFADGVLEEITAKPEKFFGNVLPRMEDPNYPSPKWEQFPFHNTDEEYLEVRPLKQMKGKPLMSEVRYWRKGDDQDVLYYNDRVDDNGRWDPFEQPRFKKRPI